MAFAELQSTWRKSFPKGTSQRFKDLDALDRVLDGTIYDKLPYPFSKEYEESGQKAYIPLDTRRPSVRFNIAKVLCDEYTSLTWAEGHGPYVQVYDPWKVQTGDSAAVRPPDEQKLEQIIQFLRHVTKMDAAMFDVQRRGSTGSSAAIIRVKEDGTPWVRAVSGKYLWPEFEDDDPDKLKSLSEIYDTTAGKLLASGYTRNELARGGEEAEDIPVDRTYMMHIKLDATAETWMVPLTEEEFSQLGEKKPGSQERYDWVEDPARNYPHGWEETPAVYGRNLQEREAIDGPCSFTDIIDIAIELDYMLSQAGRGYKYSMDPLMAFEKGELNNKFPITAGLPADQQGGEVQRTPARAVQAPPGGTVKMLEITGQGLTSARDHMKVLREWAMEVVGGMKSDQEHASGPQSGRALELLHQALVWLVGRMRIDWGDGVMVPLLRIMLRGLKKGVISLWGLESADVPDDSMPLKLVWPSWWQPRGADLYQTAQAMLIAAGGGPKNPKQLLPLQTIFQFLAAAIGLPDPVRVAEQAMQEFGEHQKQLEHMVELEKKPAPATGGTSA